MDMSDAIGQILPFAVGIALSPIPIIGVVLMLGTPAGSRNGPLFLLGWIIGIAVAGLIVIAVAGGAGANSDGAPAEWVDWLKLALGALLLSVAVRQWRSRAEPGADPELPSWMQGVDRFTPTRSVALGFALSAANPKNLVLTIGAAAAIAQTGIPAGDELICLAVFALVATLGPAIPVLAYLVRRGRASGMLASLRVWLARHSPAIMATLCVVIAAKLIGDAIVGLG
jgi:threonine/homoserine/homoserine lactone efflux protein